MIAWSVSCDSSITQSDSPARWRMSRLIAATRSTSGGHVLAVEPVRDGGRVLDKLGDVVRQEVDRGDQEVAAPHCGVQHLEVEHRLCRVQLAQLRKPLGLRPAVALKLLRFLLERREALLRQRLQRPVDNQVDELLGREEAAAVLAGIDVGTNDDLPRVVTYRLPFEQALVDRPKLLDRHVAVVDEAPFSVRFGVAQVIDERGDRRVRQSDTLQQGGGIRGEQAAVVRRQADRRVALVDEPAQRRQVVVVVGGDGGEDVPAGRPLRDVVAHPLAQAVVVIPGVVDGEKPPVLGVEHEQQSIQEDQRGLAYPRQLFPGLGCQGLHELREDPLEDHARKVLRDLLVVATTLHEGVFEEGGRRAFLEDERFAPEQQVEEAQMVFSAGLQHAAQVGLEVAGGARPGAVVVETPHAAAGQNPPPYPALRLDLRRRQVPEYLAVRRPGPAPVLTVPGIESQAEPLALFHHDGVPVSCFADASRGCPLLRIGVREQQKVRDVLVACRALLWQVVRPPQKLQHRADQLLLGHRLVRVI